MRTPTLHPRTLPAIATLALAATIGAFAAGTTTSEPKPPHPASTPPPQALAAFPAPTAAWKEVDRLQKEQKMQAALEAATKIREEAQKRGDDPEWARGLIRETQLRMSLHGYETAVRTLRETAWPDDPLPHALLDLFYAQALVVYQRSYGWEIAQREEVVSTAVTDLKQWTREQIYLEAQKAFLDAWKGRAAWGDTPVTTVGEFIAPNDYPKGIRGTLRDATSYLFAQLLADSSLWEPAQNHEIYTLPLDRLIAGEPGDKSADETIADPPAHPLTKLAAVLGDLERWHRDARREEAAFEARRERLADLHDNFDAADDRTKLRAALEKALDELGDKHPWWSRGMHTLAEWVRGLDEPQALVQARDIALRGAAKHPESVGGKLCKQLAAQISAPDYSLAAMASDGPGKRSVQVTHRNLPKLWFRAYAFDFDARIKSARDYNLLPAWQEVETLVQTKKPVASWSVDLPPTPDYRDHRTFVTPPLTKSGLYVVVASAKEAFGATANRRASVNILIGDLVLVTRRFDDGIAARVVFGSSGKPVAGAAVELWQFDWSSGHRLRQTVKTDAAGEATLKWQSDNPHFVFARHGNDLALDPQAFYGGRYQRDDDATNTLLYTDRSIYRPGQEVRWKAVAYVGSGSKLSVDDDRELTIELLDANGQQVAAQAVTTNRFGSASGTFTVPPGRLLGAWMLRSSIGGQTGLRVEEYKRPTFEVTLQEPKEALRLNRVAKLPGEARYYFGLPVTAGSVRWHVSRQPVYPYWWGWFGGGGETEPQVVAAGTATLDDEGKFEVEFTPAADEREKEDEGVTYRFLVTAEVTDDGGETRSADRSVRLGFVAVEATIEPAAGFFLHGEPGKVTLTRTDLDGTPRAGAASWRLVRLAQPEKTLLPADQPFSDNPRRRGFHETPGDRLRPRWDTDESPEAILHEWADGGEVAHGDVKHGDKGLAEVTLPAVPAGAYRLRYSTRDPFGATYETSRELLVVEPGATPLALPELLRVEKPSVPAGSAIRVLVHSGLPDQQLVVEIHRRDAPVEKRVVESSQGAQVLSIPAGDAERGGILVTATAVRDHQLMRQQAQVLVPWDEKKLQIDFATFRDRVRPRTRETWRVTVKGADEKTVAAGAAELLAYMYDRSLDLFAPHQPPDPLALYPGPPGGVETHASLRGGGESWSDGGVFAE
ncbi:MAG TPA: MG2 domain-containing protein, partial [Thermoanaerobaculia bacterium]|nr:MG2 domain-containing protein [Thermoanaerobaculia bacterium]